MPKRPLTSVSSVSSILFQASSESRFYPEVASGRSDPEQQIGKTGGEKRRYSRHIYITGWNVFGTYHVDYPFPWSALSSAV